jgi:hypothetical protein
VFVFANYGRLGTGLTRDVITDFTSGQDQVDLRGLLAQFRSNGSFAGGGQSSFYFSGGQLLGDVNGDGNMDWSLELTGVTSVASADFLL